MMNQEEHLCPLFPDLETVWRITRKQYLCHMKCQLSLSPLSHIQFFFVPLSHIQFFFVPTVRGLNLIILTFCSQVFSKAMIHGEEGEG